MINQIFAQNFVRKMEHTMNLKVNVMDERGIIVASSSRERIGSFHQIAYELIQTQTSILVTREPGQDLIGVNAPGVNLLLTSGDDVIGVIGVTGNPDEVTEIAKMAKLTFETMYEYEYRKNLSVHGKNTIWHFSHALLTETPVNEHSIKRIAGKLHAQDDYPRLPLYISLDSEIRGTLIQHFLDFFPSLSIRHSQDLVLPTERGILYLKAVKGLSAFQLGSLRTFAATLADHLEHEFFSRERAVGSSLSYLFLVGTVQTSFLTYRRIYEDLLWLSEKNSPGADRQSLLFLTDQITELFSTKITYETAEPLFSWYAGRIREEMDPQVFLETVKCLLLSDMHQETAAELLHLHKNSIIARIKRIRDILEIKPLTSHQDAVFLENLYLYMSQDQQTCTSPHSSFPIA